MTRVEAYINMLSSKSLYGPTCDLVHKLSSMLNQYGVSYVTKWTEEVFRDVKRYKSLTQNEMARILDIRILAQIDKTGVIKPYYANDLSTLAVAAIRKHDKNKRKEKANVQSRGVCK